MAIIDGLTATRMLAIEAAAVISGAVNPTTRHLILTKHDGSTIDAGLIDGVNGTNGAAGAAGSAGPVGPAGPKGPPPALWDMATAYVLNDSVGYAGMIYKALGSSTGKPPGMFTTLWQPAAGFPTPTGWSQYDPYFDGDSLLAQWETFWKTGTATTTRTTTAGEFETGTGAMKIALGTASSQRVYDKEENLVHGGEVISVEVRAKLVAAAAGVTLQGKLLQNDGANPPAPLATGLAQASSVEADPTLTTTWTTYRFNFTAANAKPRSRINITAISTGAAANVVIDRIKVRRGWYTGRIPFPFIGSLANYGAGFAACTYQRIDDAVTWSGLMQAVSLGIGAGVNWFSTPLPSWASPQDGTKIFNQHSSAAGTVMRCDVLTTGQATCQVTVGTGGYISLEGIGYNATLL